MYRYTVDRRGAPIGYGIVLLLLGIIAAETLPRGGLLRIEGGPVEFRALAQGEGARLEAATEGALEAGMADAGAPAELDARMAPAYLAGMLAARRGNRVHIVREAGAISLSV